MEHNKNKQFYPKTFTTNILKLQFTGFQPVMAGWFASILTVDPFPPHLTDDLPGHAKNLGMEARSHFSKWKQQETTSTSAIAQY